MKAEIGDGMSNQAPLIIDQDASIVREFPLCWYTRREAWVMLRGDAHVDSPFCRDDLFRAHLAEARKRKAVGLDIGDLFDAMGGRFDKRRTMHNTRPELRRDDYYDAIIPFVLEEIGKPIKQPWLYCLGNHEASATKQGNTSLTDRVVAMLRSAGHNAYAGGYAGYVRFGGDAGPLIRWHHGSGGGAIMSFGSLKVRRRGSYITAADICVSGHIHEGWSIPLVRQVVTGRSVDRHLQWHIQVPSYKDELTSASHGWSVAKEFPPAPFGCFWLQIRKSSSGDLTWTPIPEFA